MQRSNSLEDFEPPQFSLMEEPGKMLGLHHQAIDHSEDCYLLFAANNNFLKTRRANVSSLMKIFVSEGPQLLVTCQICAYRMKVQLRLVDGPASAWCPEALSELCKVEPIMVDVTSD